MLALRNRSAFSLGSLALLLPILLLLCIAPAATAQSSEGDAELDQAFTMKLNAKSTRDLDNVVDLCESAIEKGLDEEGEEQAKQLAASALFEHADQLSRQILVTANRDRRWQPLRRRALSRLKKAVEYQPDMGSAWLLITKLHQLPGGDRQRAAEAVEKAIELAGDDRRQLSSALFLRAKLSRIAGADDTLLADLDQAIKINPDNIEAYRARGEYYLRQGEPKKALDDLNRWLDTNKSTLGSIAVVEQLIAMGDKFDESLQQAAFEILDKAAENEPENPATWYSRAKIHTIQEKLDEAIEDIDEAIKLKPDSDRLLRFRASLLVDADRFSEATEAIDGILKANPDDVVMQHLRMSMLIRQSKYSQAIDQMEEIITRAPNNRGLRRQLAALYNANEQPNEAIEVYSKLLSEIPLDSIDDLTEQEQRLEVYDRSSLLQGRGNAYLSTGDHAEAIADYEEGLELAYRLRDIEDELDVEQSIDAEDSALVGILNNFAWVLATSPLDDQRDGKRAIELATEAAELIDESEAYILSTLASGYAETGDFDSALKWIGKAIEVNKARGKEIEEGEEEGQEELAKHNSEQTESLKKEQASYLEKKPWRERQTVGGEDDAEEEPDDGQDNDESDDSEPESEDSAEGSETEDDADPKSDNDSDSNDSEMKQEHQSPEDDSDLPSDDGQEKPADESAPETEDGEPKDAEPAPEEDDKPNKI